MCKTGLKGHLGSLAGFFSGTLLKGLTHCKVQSIGRPLFKSLIITGHLKRFKNSLKLSMMFNA